MADIKDKSVFGSVCFDGDCPMCRRWAGRFEPLLKRNGFVIVPLQAPAVRAALKLPEKKLLEEMRVITREGTVFGGIDALIYLCKMVPCARVFYAFSRLPGMTAILRGAYRWIARNRTCDGGACELRPLARKSGKWHDALPLLAATAGAFTFGRHLPPWAWMWTICFALFFGCKWLVLQKALRCGKKLTFARTTGFLFGWIGMDAKTFFKQGAEITLPALGNWIFAITKILFGAVLVWGIAQKLFPIDPLLAGWSGMFGLILLLHFGFFELLAFAWNKAGVDAEPLMRVPIKAQSLAEFWGRRWNTGFHKLTEDYIFNPVRRAVGPRSALMIAFLLSGLLHDAVISVPARGGYGLPTIYFLIQGAGVLFERTELARRWGVGHSWRGWLFTMIVTAGPAFWLFHPPFVRNVMIPFLQTMNAL